MKNPIALKLPRKARTLDQRTPLRVLGVLLLSGGLLRAASPADETPWNYEPFEGSNQPRPIQGCDGGRGFSEAWRHQLRGTATAITPEVLAGGLEYPGLAVSGGSCRVRSSNAMQISLRPVAEAALQAATNGAVVYLSFLLRPEGRMDEGLLNGYFVAGIAGTSGDLLAGKPGGDRMDRYVIEESGGGGQVASGVAPRIGSTALLVIKVEVLPGPDRATLYVNPLVGAPEPSSGTVKSDTDLGTLKDLWLYSTGAHQVDELRLGPTYASVVPPIRNPGKR